MKIPVTASRNNIVATLAIAGLAGLSATPAKADRIIEQEIVRNAVQNHPVRRCAIDSKPQITPPAGMMRFTGEESDFDPRRPFEQSARHAFDALGYAKSPAMAPAATPSWLFGVNAIGAR